MSDIGDQIRAAVQSGNLDDETVNRLVMHAQAEVSRLEAARKQTPEQKARIARETAAGQTASPSFMDKLGAAVGVSDTENMTADATRGANRIMNGVTMGATNALGDFFGTDSPQARAASPTPGLDNALEGTGAAVSSMEGPLAALGKGAGGLMGMLETKVPAALMKRKLVEVPVKVASAAGTGALTGASANALQAFSGGGGAQDVADAAKSGAKFGGLAGGVFGAGGIAAEKASTAIDESAGAKSRRLIERYGGNVGPLDSGSGGAFDTKLKGLTASDKDIGIAAQRAAEEVIPAHRGEYEQNVQMPYKGLKAVKDASPESRVLRDATPIYDQLNQIADSEALTDAEAKVVTKLIDRMETKYQNPAQDGPRFQMSEKRLNEFRQKLDKLSKAGSARGTTTPSVAELKGVAGEARDMVNEEGRPYADINKAYSEGSKQYREDRGSLGLKPRPSTDPAVDINKLRNNLATRGHDTQTGGSKYERLQQFKQDNPQFAETLDMPDLLNAKGDLQFRLGKRNHGGLIQRLPVEAGQPLLVAEALMHHNPGVGLGIMAKDFIGANLPALSGRLLYRPAAEAAMALSGGGLRLPGFLPEIEQAYLQALQGRQENR